MFASVSVNLREFSETITYFTRFPPCAGKDFNWKISRFSSFCFPIGFLSLFERLLHAQEEKQEVLLKMDTRNALMSSFFFSVAGGSLALLYLSLNSAK